MICHYVALLILFVSVIVKWNNILSHIKVCTNDMFETKDNDKMKLLVGILSAQSNFRARKAIRETWGKLSENKSIEIKFLVGEEICPYPIEDRITPYDCDLWSINVPKALQEYSTAGEDITTDSCEVGFTFLVKSDIVLRRLGLDYTVFSGNFSEKARVVIYNSKSGVKIASATFINGPFSGFVWKPVTPIVLEKGFEGEVNLIGINIETDCHSKVLQYIAPVHYFETLSGSGLYSPYELGDFKSSVVGMNYTLQGISGLEELLVQRTSRFQKWTLSSNLLKHQLDDEQKLYDDILLLGGFVDVYDNLSFKTALFLDWAKKLDNWLYVLKTDDDVFVDLSLVEKGLTNSWDIWTCMRNQMPNSSGKWRDRISQVYPPFPSGSGYVLSLETVKQLQLEPRTKLGEDVMIGFALNKIKKSSSEVCYWACGAMESPYLPTCNVPELNSNQLRKLWDLYYKIGHVPGD